MGGFPSNSFIPFLVLNYFELFCVELFLDPLFAVFVCVYCGTYDCVVLCVWFPLNVGHRFNHFLAVKKFIFYLFFPLKELFRKSASGSVGRSKVPLRNH